MIEEREESIINTIHELVVTTHTLEEFLEKARHISRCVIMSIRPLHVLRLTPWNCIISPKPIGSENRRRPIAISQTSLESHEDVVSSVNKLGSCVWDVKSRRVASEEEYSCLEKTASRASESG